MADTRRKPFTPIPDPPAEALKAARKRYETGGASVSDLALEFGMSAQTLRGRIAKSWKWKPPRLRGKIASAAKPADVASLRTKVRAALRRHVRNLESGLQDLTADADVERTARILASLVKTLADLARLEAARGRSTGPDDSSASADGDEPAIDLAGLRADLARRLGGALRRGDDAGDPPELSGA